MITAMLITFTIGYLLIAIERKININKTAIALSLGIILWSMYIFSGIHLIIEGAPEAFHHFISGNPDMLDLSPVNQTRKFVTGYEIIQQLGNISEILFYLLGAMTIVEAIDLHQGFSVITDKISTRSKKKLLWLVAILTFLMSSVLDNMTSAIVMVMLIRKLLPEQQERWIFGGIIVIAANSGGAWTPIGDVTTIMLWINENISSGGIMKSLFLPSIISTILPVWLASFSLQGQLTPVSSSSLAASALPSVRRTRNGILLCGILCLLAVPVFKSITDLPPFAGIMLTLSIFWIYTDLLFKHQPPTVTGPQFRIPEVLSKVDFSTILFFLGILMAVAALEAIGVLHSLSALLNTKLHNIYAINLVIGLLSSVVDNVPLVAAAMGMYPIVTPVPGPDMHYLMNFAADGDFWNLLAYCAGTGGSILIIGSAAGVVVMGLEKISFTWYIKRISWLALLGFLAGTGIYYLLAQL